MRNLVFLAILGLAAACAPVVSRPEPQPIPVAVAKVVPARDPAACATQGGNWQPICMMQKPACVLTYKDAGKACTDSSQCQGSCIVDGTAPADQPVTGVCKATSDPCGCMQFVENGKAGYPLCAD